MLLQSHLMPPTDTGLWCDPSSKVLLYFSFLRFYPRATASMIRNQLTICSEDEDVLRVRGYEMAARRYC